jgi:type IV secretory pathway protease TraF
MPGSGRCARCGASLALATAAIDVHPPRAGRFSRATPTFWRLWHAAGRLSSMASPALAAFAARTQDTHFNLPTMLRCIIPGWPQYRRGDRPRALVYFLVYMCLLLPGVVLSGTWLGSALLGLAVAMHIVSACDAIVTAFASPSDRIAFTLVSGLVLCFAVYLPTGWLISRVATPLRINATIPPFQAGEVLWYNRWATLQIGDEVVYTLPYVTAAGRNAAGYPANYVFQGDWIGRIVAMAGQTVGVANGQLVIDGVASKWQLSSGPSLAQEKMWTVPEGRAFILPNGLVPEGAQLRTDVLQQLYVVPLDSVSGRVYFRSLPLSRMSMVR